jgi:hypothetical protein
MGVRIIYGEDYTALYCSTTMTAFGPVIENVETAEEFLEWLPRDARQYSDAELSHKYSDFLAEREAHERADAPSE